MASLAGNHIDQVLGKPFQWKGRGPHAYDCIGLVIYLLREIYGIELPDPFGVESDEKLKEFRGRFIRLPNLAAAQSGDVLHMGNFDKISDQHLAFVESDKWVVATNNKIGVFRTKVQKLKHYQALDAYRPRDLC